MFVLIHTLLALTIVSASLPEENLKVPDLIKYWGYPVEEHEVVTEDGYILALHRIPYGNRGSGYVPTHEKKSVAFLQHGLLCSSSNWVTNLPHQSLGFMLADAGHDVWLGNVRGNTYSKSHAELNVDTDKFWDFTFQEMAAYDLPAMVDYALKTANRTQLYYVGHSQGTMMAFAALSENPKLQQQIKIVYALAPVAHLGNTNSPIRYFSYFETGIKWMFELLGIRDFLPSEEWVKYLADKACPVNEGVCDNILFVIAGHDQRNLNATRTPVYFTHTPAGTSVKNMLHFSQLIKANEFQRYDYGFFKNMRKYGWFYPTKYDLKKFTNRVALVSGSNDWLADPADVEWLSKELHHVITHRKIDEYNHLDFIWGLSAHEKVYRYILSSMNKYDKKQKFD